MLLNLSVCLTRATVDGVNVSPSSSEFLELAKQGNIIPVYTDLTADMGTPVSVYHCLSEDRPAFLFESITGGEHISRYSFVGCSPKAQIIAYEQETHIHHRDGNTEVIPTPADPLNVVEQMMAKFKVVETPGMPRFHGGAVGFVGYEYVHRVETTVQPAKEDTLGMPLIYFMLADSVVIFDHAHQRLRLCVNAHLDEQSPEQAYEAALSQLHQLSQKLTQSKQLAPAPIVDVPQVDVPAGNFTRENFEKIVDTSKEYIRSGDVIQVVASQRFEADYPQQPIDLYRALRVVNPSPYMFIIDSGTFACVGASPEVHVRLTGDLCELRPIAGTRPRGKDAAQDKAFEVDLLADEKERAEHLMLVDLARNDLGRVCKMGSVEVSEYMIIERYSHVMHIVSNVHGTLDTKHNAYDLMRATFPAGTVSGAPKVRAMQIISELEGSRRGPYAGALGYFGYEGNLDSCIAIRTALLKDGKIYIQSGAGLVADSVPENEYQETINKARAMLKAVKLSQRITHTPQ